MRLSSDTPAVPKYSQNSGYITMLYNQNYPVHTVYRVIITT